MPLQWCLAPRRARAYRAGVDLFVTAAAGTEGALRDELRELRLRVRADRGGVHVLGARPTDVWKVCLLSRIAIRVLVPVATFECADEDALYGGVHDLDLGEHLDPRLTIAVSAVAKDGPVTHTSYIAQRTKDAIVDRQRREKGLRSSVDRDDPDVAIFVHLKGGVARVFLDASGQSLHLRGWRNQTGGVAPLKETLAAAILRLSEWDRRRDLVDPMCGSGTIAIEADLWARNVPPSSRSRRFGFERWASFDAARAKELEAMRGEAAAAIRDEGPTIFAADVDAGAIELARGNAERARARARFRVAPLAALRPFDPPAHLCTNAPYGARLDAEWDELRAALRRLERHGAAVLGPDEPGLHLCARRPDARYRLRNGRIPCALSVWREL